MFATQLARIVNSERIDRYLGVPSDNIPNRRLEQRLGLLSDPPNPLILLLPRRVYDREAAEEYAHAARAGILIAGSRRVEGELDISLYFARASQAIDDAPAGVVGSSEIREISRKPVDLVDVETLQKALAWLLAGYRKYHAPQPEYENALESFGKGLNALDGVSDEQLKGLIGAIKATLYLYQGNVLLLRGNLDGAAQAYRSAEALSMVGSARMFIEPVNNLAYVERARGNSYPIAQPGNGLTAREQLQAVTADCGVEESRITVEACASVWYNLGGTFHDEADTEDDDAHARRIYAEAATYFGNAIELLHTAETDNDHREQVRLLAEAYQNQAYGLAKQAERNPTVSDGDLDAIARKSEQAAGTLRRHGMSVPPLYALTPVRIRLMRRQWDLAGEDLKRLRADEATLPLWGKAELQLLLAAAERCSGRHAESEASLRIYRELAGSLPNPDRAQFREIQEIPRLTRHCPVAPAKKG
jgi:tetratricopeptide (TPR) repeat protein